MFINFEIILISFVILASNGFIYSLPFLNKYSNKIVVIANNLERNTWIFTSLIASNPINIISSESSTSDVSNITSSDSSLSDNLSITDSETVISDSLSVTSSETLVSEDIFDSDENLLNFEDRIMTHTENSILSSPYDGPLPDHIDVFENTRSLDSVTILNGQTLEAWRDAALTFHDFPVNSPANILQLFKWEELRILYSQDMIEYGITQTELRLIIELIPAMDLFKPGINHLILTMMSYFHM